MSGGKFGPDSPGSLPVYMLLGTYMPLFHAGQSPAPASPDPMWKWRIQHDRDATEPQARTNSPQTVVVALQAPARWWVVQVVGVERQGEGGGISHNYCGIGRQTAVTGNTPHSSYKTGSHAHRERPWSSSFGQAVVSRCPSQIRAIPSHSRTPTYNQNVFRDQGQAQLRSGDSVRRPPLLYPPPH